MTDGELLQALGLVRAELRDLRLVAIGAVKALERIAGAIEERTAVARIHSERSEKFSEAMRRAFEEDRVVDRDHEFTCSRCKRTFHHSFACGGDGAGGEICHDCGCNAVGAIIGKKPARG